MDTSIPPYLIATTDMLRAAFPHGLARDHRLYRALVTVLYQSEGGLCFEHLAFVLTAVLDVDPGIAMNDAFGIAQNLDSPECREVIEILRLHGYDAWNVEESSALVPERNGGAPPSNDLGWYVEGLRALLPGGRVDPLARTLFSEQVEFDSGGRPCALGALSELDEYRPRFADLLARRFSWINLHALGLLNAALVVSVELPSSASGTSPRTSVNLSGPGRAVVERDCDLASFLRRR